MGKLIKMFKLKKVLKMNGFNVKIEKFPFLKYRIRIHVSDGIVNLGYYSVDDFLDSFLNVNTDEFDYIKFLKTHPWLILNLITENSIHIEDCYDVRENNCCSDYRLSTNIFLRIDSPGYRLMYIPKGNLKSNDILSICNNKGLCSKISILSDSTYMKLLSKDFDQILSNIVLKERIHLDFFTTNLHKYYFDDHYSKL